MPSQPPTRRKPGREPSRLARDTSKKNVSLNKAAQKGDMALKAMAKKLEEQQRAWKKQRDDAAKLQAGLEKLMQKIKDDRTLDQRFMGQVKKFGSELVKLEKQMKVLAKASENPKTFAEVQVQATRVPAVSKVQTYADLSMFLAMLIVVFNRAM